MTKMLTLHFCEPLGLPVMLRSAGNGVEEHQQKHQPVEVGGLDGHAAVLPHGVVQLAQLVAEKKGEEQREEMGPSCKNKGRGAFTHQKLLAIIFALSETKEITRQQRGRGDGKSGRSQRPHMSDAQKPLSSSR